MIIVLNGFPGTGKFTILTRVRELMPADKNCILLDNHLLIDPVAAVMPERNAEHHELRRMVRAPIFQKLRKRAKEGCVILTTACLAEGSDVDAAVLEEYLDLARETDVSMYWFNAHCDQAILEQRLTSDERRQGTKTKLTDVRVLSQLFQKHRLIQPTGTDTAMRLVVRTLDANGPLETTVQLLMSSIG